MSGSFRRFTCLLRQLLNVSDHTPDCDPQEQNARQAQLEAWYEADGRTDPSHPMHGLYTGLAETYAALRQ